MTLPEFKNWALQQSQVGKYDDGQYVGECVSLVNQYCYRVLGVPAGAWGHAYAWANDDNPNRQYFDKVGSPQDGDVIVYGTNFTPLFGHIGIFIGGQLLDQNGHKVQHVAIGVLFKGYNAILRHKGGTPGGDMPSLTNKDDVDNMYASLLGRAVDDQSANWVGIPWPNAFNGILKSDEGVAYSLKVKDALAGGSNGQYEQVTVYRKVS